MPNFALLIFVGLLFGTAASALTPINIAEYVVERDELVGDKTLDSYANDWWKWTFSMQQAESPVRDQDGSHCHVNQSGSVWFLAGGYGTSKISRWCTLPSQHIFFPVINMVAFSPNSSMTCEEAKVKAAQNNNDFTYVRVFLNGSQLENAERFRIAPAECFDIFERVPKKYKAPAGTPSATDGFWVMLKPLPAGEYILEFRAFYTNQNSSYGDMVQNISYNLTILAPD